MKKIWAKALENKKTLIILFAILLVGIFLRTYKFHEWLRFSVDQSRDARIVSDALESRNELPLLGPKANTTTFKLGPVYYYFSYASAKIFGNYPDKMAWPSLVFSILAIPLLFLFLRKYFRGWISLAATGLMSVSYLMVFNSRFSSNPNLVPFFILLLLYSLLEILNRKDKPHWVWYVLVGASLGICVQLHTTLLVALPIVAILFFAYVLFKKYPQAWKGFAIVIAVSAIVNVTQFVYEFGSNWSNAKSFLSGFQNNRSKNLAKGVYLISACQIQANSYYLSSVVSSPQDNSNNVRCTEIFQPPKEDRWFYFSTLSASVLFSVLGYLLLFQRFWKEKIPERKNFLGLVILLNIVSLAIFMPVAKMMNTGYLVVLFMIPFVLLGLFFENLEKKFSVKGKLFAVLITAFFITLSLAKDISVANQYAQGAGNSERGSTLGEIERMSEYILSESGGSKKIYFSGDKDLANRFYKPISYFAYQSGIEAELTMETAEKGAVEKGIPYFYIREKEKGEMSPGQVIRGFEILSSREFSSQTIFILYNKFNSNI